jgi:hypothetical protein
MGAAGAGADPGGFGAYPIAADRLDTDTGSVRSLVQISQQNRDAEGSILKI